MRRDVDNQPVAGSQGLRSAVEASAPTWSVDAFSRGELQMACMRLILDPGWLCRSFLMTGHAELRRNEFLECPAKLNASGRGDDAQYFSLWEPDVRLDQQYLWRCAFR